MCAEKMYSVSTVTATSRNVNVTKKYMAVSAWVHIDYMGRGQTEICGISLSCSPVKYSLKLKAAFCIFSQSQCDDHYTVLKKYINLFCGHFYPK